MSAPVWDPSFSVGHPVLDSQHKELLLLCKHAAECMEDTTLEGVEHFHALLNDLAVYAKKHFRTEEKILSQINCPLLDEQKAEHEEYEIWLSETLLSAMDGSADKAAVHQFLSTWWMRHILESDMRYSEFLSGIKRKY
jgi:hemerythrin